MMEVSKSVLGELMQVADSQVAWEQGTRVCYYRPVGAPDNQVMLCNRTAKGSLERLTVTEQEPMVERVMARQERELLQLRSRVADSVHARQVPPCNLDCCSDCDVPMDLDSTGVIDTQARTRFCKDCAIARGLV